MARHYELVLMLDPEASESDRETVAGDAQKLIESSGTLDHAEGWGMRKMAYEIRQRTEADYRFYRFQGEPALLEQLDHNLKIADGALRFRVFEVDPSTPTSAPPAASQMTAMGGERRGRDRD
jgi:small subunit ribosomal protein S6